MSKFRKGCRCDTCGKIANNRAGEYVRQDGSAGYIMPEDNENPGERDVCTDCVDDEMTATSIVNEWVKDHSLGETFEQDIDLKNRIANAIRQARKK